MTSISPLIGGKVAPWCSAADVAADKRLAQVELPDGITIGMIVQSVSERLYKMTGARWMGAQTAIVRPHRLNDGCRCDLSGMMAPSWGADTGGGWWNRVFPEGAGCQCHATQVDLAGGNVISVDEVLVDGAVLAPAKYALYDNRRLVRLQDPTLGTAISFYCCQRLEVPTTEPGTWQVTYTFGQLPPVDGQIAAYAYAVERAIRFDTARHGFPPQTRSVRAQDIDITIDDGQGIAAGRVGIPEVDEFVEAWNPHSLLRRARVYDPDTISGAVVGRSQTP